MDGQSIDRCFLKIHEVLSLIGEYGRYQKLLSGIFFLINLPVSYQVLIMYFSTLTPRWKCMYNSTVCIWNDTLAGDDSRRCHIPRDEWEYTEPKEFSLVTTFDIHCSEEWLLYVVLSVFFIGSAIGSVLFGWIADNYGRKIMIFPSLVIMLVVGFISSFLPNIYMIIVCRFIVGFFVSGTTIQGFILTLEVVSSEKRPLAGLMVYIASPIAWSILGLKAYLLQNWSLLSIFSTAPYIPFIVFYRFIPESIEWLQVQGRLDDVMNTFREIARWNNKPLASNVFISPPKIVLGRKVTPLDIFRGRRIAFLCIIHCLLWCFGGMGYFGIALAANDLGGSAYRDFILLSLCELPAFVCAIYLSTRFGRKPATLLPYFMGCSALLIVAFIPMVFKLSRVVIGIIGKFLVAIAYNTNITWTGETFPTHIRSMALSFANISLRIGSAGAPWVVDGLKSFAKWIPFVVIGISLFVVSLSAIWLPETKEVTLTERQCVLRGTVAPIVTDLEMIGKSNDGYTEAS